MSQYKTNELLVQVLPTDYDSIPERNPGSNAENCTLVKLHPAQAGPSIKEHGRKPPQDKMNYNREKVMRFLQ